jgi:hypothetical protein
LVTDERSLINDLSSLLFVDVARIEPSNATINVANSSFPPFFKTKLFSLF